MDTLAGPPKDNFGGPFFLGKRRQTQAEEVSSNDISRQDQTLREEGTESNGSFLSEMTAGPPKDNFGGPFY